MIKYCNGCGHKPHSQDELHGKGMRVFNEHKDKDRRTHRKCTRCGNEEVVFIEDKKE
jgi:hypothetical protein